MFVINHPNKKDYFLSDYSSVLHILRKSSSKPRRKVISWAQANQGQPQNQPKSRPSQPNQGKTQGQKKVSRPSEMTQVKPKVSFGNYHVPQKLKDTLHIFESVASVPHDASEHIINFSICPNKDVLQFIVEKSKNYFSSTTVQEDINKKFNLRANTEDWWTKYLSKAIYVNIFSALQFACLVQDGSQALGRFINPEDYDKVYTLRLLPISNAILEAFNHDRRAIPITNWGFFTTKVNVDDSAFHQLANDILTKEEADRQRLFDPPFNDPLVNKVIDLVNLSIKHYADKTGNPNPLLKQTIQYTSPVLRSTGNPIISIGDGSFIPGNVAGFCSLNGSGPSVETLVLNYLMYTKVVSFKSTFNLLNVSDFYISVGATNSVPAKWIQPGIKMLLGIDWRSPVITPPPSSPGLGFGSPPLTPEPVQPTPGTPNPEIGTQTELPEGPEPNGPITGQEGTGAEPPDQPIVPTSYQDVGTQTFSTFDINIPEDYVDQPVESVEFSDPITGTPTIQPASGVLLKPSGLDWLKSTAKRLVKEVGVPVLINVLTRSGRSSKQAVSTYQYNIRGKNVFVPSTSAVSQ